MTLSRGLRSPDTSSPNASHLDADQAHLNVCHPRWGAWGDGIHNDGPAIQAALDHSWQHLNGLPVYLPDGTYRVQDALLVYSGSSDSSAGATHLQGAGMDRAVLHYTGTGSAIQPYNSTLASPSRTLRVDLRDFSITGTSSGQVGLDLTGAQNWLVTRVKVYGFSKPGAEGTGGEGVRLMGNQTPTSTQFSSVTCQLNLLHGCEFYGNTFGTRVVGTTRADQYLLDVGGNVAASQCTDNVFLDCYWTDAGGATTTTQLLLGNNTVGTTVIGGQLYWNGDATVVLRGHYNTLIGCAFEAGKGPAVRFMDRDAGYDGRVDNSGAGTVTAGSKNFTVGSATFLVNPDDVGKTISVAGAGPNGGLFRTTIATVTGDHSGTFTDTPSTTPTPVRIWIGTGWQGSFGNRLIACAFTYSSANPPNDSNHTWALASFAGPVTPSYTSAQYPIEWYQDVTKTNGADTWLSCSYGNSNYPQTGPLRVVDQGTPAGELVRITSDDGGPYHLRFSNLTATAASKLDWANYVGNTGILTYDTIGALTQKFTIDQSGNVGVGTTSFGGAVGALGLKVATTAPASTPTSTFVLYVDPADSKLKAKGPSGTVTPLADP